MYQTAFTTSHVVYILHLYFTINARQACLYLTHLYTCSNIVCYWLTFICLAGHVNEKLVPPS